MKDTVRVTKGESGLGLRSVLTLLQWPFHHTELPASFLDAYLCSLLLVLMCLVIKQQQEVTTGWYEDAPKSCSGCQVSIVFSLRIL